uniref:CAP-Gly domain-containing protein n=1 Tax=Kalanchoe fedtschenkoi TaxID=63787 RepID=A0A7N0U8T7_KALFE
MPNSDVEKPPDSVELTTSAFTIDQRVHFAGDSRRIGTVKYVGPVEGYSGLWVGVDWDDGEGKHDGSVNGVCYFHAKTPKSASFVRPHNISAGVTVLEALELRYKGTSTKEEEDEMYVLSASNRRVSVQLLGKDKIQDKLSKFEELEGVSLSYLGVSSSGVPGQIGSVLLSLRRLDLTGNLLSDWKSIASICEQLPMLSALNLSHNKLSYDVTGLPMLKNLRIVVLNHTGVQWTQVEVLKHSLPALEELHLMGNELREITPPTSKLVQGFDSLRLLNLEDNLFEDWAEISKLSQLRSLEQLQLNNNNLKDIAYPDHDIMRTPLSGQEQLKQGDKPFQHLCCLLLGGNNINDISAVDSLNYFPNLVDIRLSDNPVADPGKGGVPRFVLIARLAKVQMLNGSEVSPRERKESEIRYIRLVMSKSSNLKEIQQMHPRFAELKVHHGIEDERPSSTGAAGPQKMASGLLSVTLKCVGASIGEKPPLTKKLPATTTVRNCCLADF